MALFFFAWRIRTRQVKNVARLTALAVNRLAATRQKLHDASLRKVRARSCEVLYGVPESKREDVREVRATQQTRHGLRASPGPRTSPRRS